MWNKAKYLALSHQALQEAETEVINRFQRENFEKYCVPGQAMVR